MRMWFLLLGGSSPYRKIRRGWNGSRSYVTRTVPSISTGCVHHSGSMRTCYHNGIVHNLGAVLCPQGQAEGSRETRIVVLLLLLCNERIREVTTEGYKSWDAFSINAGKTYTNYTSFKIWLKINDWKSMITIFFTVTCDWYFLNFRSFSLPLRISSISSLIESPGEIITGKTVVHRGKWWLLLKTYEGGVLSVTD